MDKLLGIEVTTAEGNKLHTTALLLAGKIVN